MGKLLFAIVLICLTLLGFRYATIKTISSVQLSEQIQMQLRNDYNKGRLDAIQRSSHNGDWRATFNNAASIFLTQIQLSSIISSPALFEQSPEKHHILKVTYFMEESSTSKEFFTTYYLAILNENTEQWHLTRNSVNDIMFYTNNVTMW